MQTILITGSSKRIGKELAIQFANKNYNIVLHYLNSETEALELQKYIKSLNVSCNLVRGDISKPDDILYIYEYLRSKQIEMDILINNAAIFPKQKSLTDSKIEDWEEVINTNLRSVYLMSKYFVENNPKAKKIINLASIGAFHIWKQRVVYNTSKAGVIQLTKALAVELAPKIAVNSVSPGIIDFDEGQITNFNTINKQYIPFGRYGFASEVFEAIYFFATSSNYITGQNISVDGGLGLL